MYTQTLYELSQEAERLLQLSRQQLQLLEKMPLSVPGDDAPQLALPWSQPNIAERHAMLNNELRKISRLEMVLAIVGTMKAGKSTTINAIVGTEVLPNRNRPMTALPTLIRHTPGQKEPVLHFSHVAPIDCLIQQLQQRLRDCDIKHLTDVLEIDKDMRALMQRIENGVAFEKYYLGAQPIFHCLKSLNDLVRLAKALDVDFPFSAYAAIEHIPVIEVEFVHLAGLESYPGQLTLLDTPGPNEAGQPHLQKMLNQQLARASAVLAVLDYTQLKSISDEEVREAILAVGQSVPLYVLVNKFDQQDRNSDDADQVRALISGTLMKGCITPQQIFPVSSMWGYLANRARHELANNGKLPAPEQQRWVEDFAHAALGRRWRHDDLADLEHIRHAADQLWEDSLFAQPIQALLHAAYANASLYALRSAAHKLLNYAQQARGYLDFRAHGLNVACEQLRQNIHQVEESLQLLQLNQAQVSGEVKHEIELALTSANHFLRQQQIAALYEWFSARCRWKEKALTQRGLLVQAGEQSEQIFTRWRAGAYNAWSLPGRCFIVLEELRWGAFGDACRLGSPQAVALLLGDLRVKATQHLAESINAAPTTRHYYHQWFASSTVPTGGDHADFLSWLGKWTTADKQPVCWSVTQRWQTVALGMPRLCSAQRLAGAMVEEIFSVNLA